MRWPAAGTCATTRPLGSPMRRSICSRSPPTAASVQLPPALAGDATFAEIVDPDGRPIDDAWRARRRALLLDAFARADPRVVLIELYPFGRRAFRFELSPLLEAAIGRRPPPALVCS